MDNANHDAPCSAAKSLTNIIFLVDASESINDEKFEAINTALQEFVPFIREFGQADASVKVQCSVLCFNEYANWVAKTIEASQFYWPHMNRRKGPARLDSAYMELLLKLTRGQDGFMQAHRNKCPIIILVAGWDIAGNIDTALAILKRNSWFQRSTKFAVYLPALWRSNTMYMHLRKFVNNIEENIVSLDRSLDKLKNVLMNIETPSFGGSSNGIDDVCYESCHVFAEDQNIEDWSDIGDIDDFDWENIDV